MNPTIGIMQGRLSPPVGGRIQAFPAAHWREEFDIAARLGLDSIEWILESPLEENPLWQPAGVRELRRVIEATGVAIRFICADYFMEAPFVRMDGATRRRNQEVLRRAIDHAAALGAAGLEIPCVDASAIRSEAEEAELADALAPGLDAAQAAGVALGLETSLPPERFAALLARIGHPAVRANYDSGNSASLGYDPRAEFAAYGRLINNVHIKDRRLHGTTVPLGEGDTDIPLVLRLLAEVGYTGTLILQAARGADDVAVARGYKAQVEGWLRELAGTGGPS